MNLYEHMMIESRKISKVNVKRKNKDSVDYFEKDLPSLVDDGIYHYESDLGRDWEYDDIVGYVEDRVYEEPEKYSKAVDLMKEPESYNDFYYAVVSAIDNFTRNRDSSTYEESKNLREDHYDDDDDEPEGSLSEIAFHFIEGDTSHYEEEEVEEAQQLSDVLGCEPTEVVSVPDEELPSTYEKLASAINSKKFPRKILWSEHGEHAELVDLKGIKVIFRGSWGYYEIIFREQDADKLDRFISGSPKMADKKTTVARIKGMNGPGDTYFVKNGKIYTWSPYDGDIFVGKDVDDKEKRHNKIKKWVEKWKSKEASDNLEFLDEEDYYEESKKRVSESRSLSKSSRKRVNEATYDYTVTIKPKNTRDPEERFTGNSVEDLKRIVKNNVISKDEIVSVQGCSIDDLFEESKNLDEGRSDMIRDARSRRKSRDQLRQTQGSDRSMVSAISRLGRKYLRDYGDRLNDDALALYELVDTSDDSSEMMRAMDELSKCKLVINSDPYSLVYSIGASLSGTSSAIIDPSDDGSPSIIIDLFSVGHWMFVNENGDVFWCNDGGLGGTRPEDAPDRYKIFDGSSKEFTSFYSDFENSEEGQGDDYFIDYYRGLRALFKNTTEGNMSQIEEILDEYDKDIPLDDDEFDLLDIED